MKTLLEHLAQALVDAPDEVIVSEESEGSAATFKLEVAPDDLGKVIGRRGKTAAAMRTLLSATASKQGTRAALEIVD